VRVAKCLPVNRGHAQRTANYGLRGTPKRGQSPTKNAAQLEGPGRRKFFQSPSLVVNDGETQRCRRSASGEKDVLRVYA
jgi:hypothetical protein